MNNYLNNNIIFQLLNNLSIFFLYFVNYYFYNRFLGFKRKKYIFFVVQIIMTFINVISNNLLGDLLKTLICLAIEFVTIYLICNGDILIKIYSVIVSSLVQLLVSLMFLIINIKFVPMVYRLLSINHSNYKILNYLVVNFCDFINLFIAFIFFKCICNTLKIKDRNINKYQALYLLIPNLSIYGLALLFFDIQKVKINNSNYFLFNIFIDAYYSLPLISLFMLITVPIMAYMFARMLDNEEEKQKRILMNQQLIHNKNVEKVYNNLRGIIHDMNNHITCLKNLANNEKIEEIKVYLNDMGYEINKVDFNIKTGNSIADAVINEKYSIAKEKNIQFECDFMLPCEINIKPIDLSIILNNALDNAIEACMNIKNVSLQKKISIKTYIRDAYAIVEIANSMENRVIHNVAKAVTTKPDTLRHGFGISNIKNSVKKYNGTMDIKEEKNKFIINIMLKIK